MQTAYANEITLTRLIRAPRELVWRAWADPIQLAKWWGPKDFTNPRCEVDLRAGGGLYADMTAPDGTVYPCFADFEEVTPQSRIVFVSGALGADGKPMFKVRHTLTLADQDGKTALTLHAQVIETLSPHAGDHIKGMREGWSQSLDRLDALVAA